MGVNDHRRIVITDWHQKKHEEHNEVADVLKDNVNVYQNNQEQIRQHEIQQRQKETGASEHEAEKNKKNEIADDKVFARKNDIAAANRLAAENKLKKDGIKLTRRQRRKSMLNADNDFAVRDGKRDPLGLARAGKQEIKDLPVASLFTSDLSKIPSSRRRIAKKQRTTMLGKMEKSKSLRDKSNLFKGKKLTMKKVSSKDLSKQDMMHINRLRGLGVKSPTKGRAAGRSLSRAELIKRQKSAGR